MLDYIIRNAKVVDGTGSPAYRAAVGITGDRITAIIKDGAPLPEAKNVIDAEGKLLTPGFIDIHNHGDMSISFEPECDNFVLQGITSFVGGNCGQGAAPALKEDFVEDYLMGHQQLKGLLDVKWTTFGSWLEYMKEQNIGVNYVPLIPHNNLRGSVMGSDSNRVSTEQEEKEICALLEEGLNAGAFGMTYIADPGQPGHWASRSEMEKLFKVLENHNSYVSTHARHHQNQWVSDDGRNYYGVFVDEPGEIICGRYHGYVEFLELLRTAPKLTAVYAHLVNSFLIPHPHSQTMENALIDETLRTFVDEPVAEGLNVYFNVLPDEHSLSALQRVVRDLKRSMVYDAELKAYATDEALLANLSDSAFRQKLKKYINSGKFKMGMLSPATDPYWSECFTFVTAKDASLLKRTLMDVTKERRPNGTRHDLVYSDCLEVLFDLVLEDPDLEWALTRDNRYYLGINRLVQHPRCMPMTDSSSFPEGAKKDEGHFGYGTPPVAFTGMIRFLASSSRDKGLVPMEEAIRRMTSLPADVMRISDRGRIVEGAKADLVLMDWEKLGYVVDYNNPSVPPTGIDYVFVNGVPALEKGRLTRACTGQVLTRT